jgi:hypothetical protein
MPSPSPSLSNRFGQVTGDAPILPILMIMIGGYLAWFGIHYWEDEKVIWPSDPVKDVLQGKGVPVHTTTTTAAIELTAAESEAAQAQSSSGGSGGGASQKQHQIQGPANASEKAFWTAVLAGIGAPPTSQNINSLTAWRTKESPWNAQPPDGALYTHNPLNTTMPGFGATGNVNSVGVKIYPTPADGVAATVATLHGYPSILMALRSGRGLCGNPSLAGDFSKWSGGGYSSVC